MGKDTAAAELGRRQVLAGLGVLASVGPAWARNFRERHLRLVCPETGEHFAGAYWVNGHYLADAMRRIDWLMRDFHCDAVAQIDPRLIDMLHDLRLHLGTARPVSILSGYRTRGTNHELLDHGLPAVSDSQHLVAHAADIVVEGVSVSHLHAVALRLKRGGVGGYDRHVHVDTGPVRAWAYHRHRHSHHHSKHTLHHHHPV